MDISEASLDHHLPIKSHMLLNGKSQTSELEESKEDMVHKSISYKDDSHS